MTDETKLYNFRLPIALMERVKAMAATHGMNVTEAVLTRLRVFADDGPASGPDKMREEIATLKKALATAKATRPAKGIDSETRGQLEAFSAEVASLKRELAKRPGVGLSSRTAAVSGIQSDKPVTALDLPVLTDFPKRPFGQRGADKAKGKKP